MRKGFALPLILVVVLVGIVIGFFGLQFYLKNKVGPLYMPGVSIDQTPTPQATSPSQIDETANWKTYTNSNVGYQISYPQNIKFNETKLEGEGLLGALVPPAEINHMTTLIFSEDGRETMNISSAINIDRNYGFDAKFIAENFAKTSAYPSKVLEAQLDGGQAYKVEPVKPFENMYIFHLFVNGRKLNSAYVIQGGVDLSNKKTIDQILSTFQFID